MKMKQLILLTGVLAAVYAGVMYSKRDDADKPDAKVGQKLFDAFPADKVATIELNGGKEEVVLELKNNKWGVKGRDGYPANFDNIDSLVKRVTDLYVRSVKTPVDEKNLGNFKLQAPGTGGNDDQTGTLVILKDAEGKVLAHLTVGKAPSGAAGAMGGGGGQYVLDKEAPTKAYVIKNGFDYFINDITNKAWVDKTTFFQPAKHKSVTVTTGKPENDWRLYREKEGTDAAEIKLADAKVGEEFDTAKATGSAAAFSSMAFNDVAVATEAAAAALDKPIVTSIIETFDGFKYTVKVGAAVPPAANADPASAAGTEEHFVSADIEATFSETAPEWKPTAEEEKKTDDEKKKLKETADAAFQTELKTKKDKLAKEKELAGKVFKIAKSSLEPLLKSRKDFMKDKPAEGAAPATPGAPAATPSLPPAPVANAVSIPPAPAPKRESISATTPPIAVDVKDGKAVATPVSAEELKKAEDAAKAAAEKKAEAK